MSNASGKKQSTQPTSTNPKEELIHALLPLKNISWIERLIKKIKEPGTHLPHGKNANTEKFTLGLSISLCLFEKHNAALMKSGRSLKNYTDKYAGQTPVAQAPFIINKLNELIAKNKKIR